MRRTTRLITGTAVAALTAVVVAGCSSSGTSVDAKPSASQTPSTPAGTSAPTTTSLPSPFATTPGRNGHLDYTGDSRGGFDVATGVTCSIAGGKLVAVMTSDLSAGSTLNKPSFMATDAATHQLAMLVTPDGRTYMQESSTGMQGHKSGGHWTVTVRNLRIATSLANADDPRAVTVNGTLACTEYPGAGGM